MFCSVDRLRARRDADSNFGVPQELDGEKKRKLLKDLKYQSAELRETGRITPDSQENLIDIFKIPYFHPKITIFIIK